MNPQYSDKNHPPQNQDYHYNQSYRVKRSYHNGDTNHFNRSEPEFHHSFYDRQRQERHEKYYEGENNRNNQKRVQNFYNSHDYHLKRQKPDEDYKSKTIVNQKRQNGIQINSPKNERTDRNKNQVSRSGQHSLEQNDTMEVVPPFKASQKINTEVFYGEYNPHRTNYEDNTLNKQWEYRTYDRAKNDDDYLKQKYNKDEGFRNNYKQRIIYDNQISERKQFDNRLTEKNNGQKWDEDPNKLTVMRKRDQKVQDYKSNTQRNYNDNIRQYAKKEPEEDQVQQIKKIKPKKYFSAFLQSGCNVQRFKEEISKIYFQQPREQDVEAIFEKEKDVYSQLMQSSVQDINNQISKLTYTLCYKKYDSWPCDPSRKQEDDLSLALKQKKQQLDQTITEIGDLLYSFY